MTDPTCARCEKPLRHDTALICASCAALLHRRLEFVVRIAGDVTLTIAKLARVTTHGSNDVEQEWYRGPNALEAQSLPPDLDRAERHDAAVGELSTWLRVVAEERGTVRRPWVGRVDRPPQRMHPLAEIATGLMGNLEWLRHHSAAGEAWPKLIDATHQLERVIDTQLPGVITGLCDCGSAIYGTRCDRCKGETVLAYDRPAMDAATSDYAVTAAEAAQWVADMGLVTDTRKLSKLIWAWGARGHLEAVDETPRYRFGDVLARVMASPALRVA